MNLLLLVSQDSNGTSGSQVAANTRMQQAGRGALFSMTAVLRCSLQVPPTKYHVGANRGGHDFQRAKSWKRDSRQLGIGGFPHEWSRGVARWFRWSLSVADPFVCRCLTSSAMLPFPHPAHRTGRADFPHPALGERFTVSPTGNYSSAWQGGRGPALRAEMTAETAWSPTPTPCAWHITTDAASCKRDCPPLDRPC